MTFLKQVFTNQSNPGNGSTTVYVPDLEKTWTDTGVDAPFSKNYVVRVGSNYYACGWTGSAASGNIWSAPVNDCTNWSVVGTLPASKTVAYGRMNVIGENIYIFGGVVANSSNNNREIFSAPIGTPTTFTDTGTLLSLKAYSCQSVVFDKIYLLPSQDDSNGWFYAEKSTPTVWASLAKTTGGYEFGGMTVDGSLLKLTGNSSAVIHQYDGSLSTTTVRSLNVTTSMAGSPTGYDAGDKVYFFGGDSLHVVLFQNNKPLMSGTQRTISSVFPFNTGSIFGAHWIYDGYFYVIHPTTRRIWRSARKALTCAFIPSGLEPFQAYNQYGGKEWVSRHVRLGYSPWFTNRFDI
jgi:hypothetical protein